MQLELLQDTEMKEFVVAKGGAARRGAKCRQV
jgi:hypothetical protein